MPQSLFNAHKHAALISSLPIEYITPPTPSEPPSYFVGRIMNSIVYSLIEKSNDNAIICFLDLDAFPLNINKFWRLLKYSFKNATTIACSASSNHISPYNEEFISPWFSIWNLNILREAFKANVTFMPSPVGDVCQDISRYLFSTRRQPILLSPLRYHQNFNEQKKGMLCGSRKYGYSTLYESSLLHGFQSRVHPPDHFIKLLRFAENLNFSVEESDLKELNNLSSIPKSIWNF